MDDRLRLLKRIRFVCRVAQWLLLLAIVGWGYFYVRVTWQTVSLTGQSLTQAVMTLAARSGIMVRTCAATLCFIRRRTPRIRPRKRPG